MPSLSPDDEVAVMATGGSSKGLPLVTEMKNLLQRKLRSNLTGVCTREFSLVGKRMEGESYSYRRRERAPLLVVIRECYQGM